MALFRRNKENDVLPEEVRDYYQAERRDRKGMAWLLAFGTLLVTFLLAAGLFFGGRWIYRAIFDDDKGSPSTSQTENNNGESAANTDGDQADDFNTDTSTGSTDPNSGGATSSTNTTTPSGTGGTATTGTVGGATTTTPSTGPSTLVNTGPGDE